MDDTFSIGSLASEPLVSRPKNFSRLGSYSPKVHSPKGHSPIGPPIGSPMPSISLSSPKSSYSTEKDEDEAIARAIAQAQEQASRLSSPFDGYLDSPKANSIENVEEQDDKMLYNYRAELERILDSRCKYKVAVKDPYMYILTGRKENDIFVFESADNSCTIIFYTNGTKYEKHYKYLETVKTSASFIFGKQIVEEKTYPYVFQPYIYITQSSPYPYWTSKDIVYCIYDLVCNLHSMHTKFDLTHGNINNLTIYYYNNRWYYKNLTSAKSNSTEQDRIKDIDDLFDFLKVYCLDQVDLKKLFQNRYIVHNYEQDVLGELINKVKALEFSKQKINTFIELHTFITKHINIQQIGNINFKKGTGDKRQRGKQENYKSVFENVEKTFNLDDFNDFENH